MNTTKFKDFNKFAEELGSLFEKYGFTRIVADSVVIECDKKTFYLKGNYFTQDYHIHFTRLVFDDSNEYYDVKVII